MKHRVTAIVRDGDRMYGFSIPVEASKIRITNALTQAYGSDNVIFCTIRKIK